ncbi:MAG TPA: peptidylprolyl isomerase [Rhizomicrobium sp.]|jgi:cyclophilin family peptidyl-prolyl cis-trans isomerase|nr:peptidylprolyl isomerase [Rhizomicrobium sp.]
MRAIAGVFVAILFTSAAWADDAPTPAPDDTAAPAPAETPAPPPPAPVYTGPVVTMETSMGTITITLDAEHAPISTANFLRYVRDKHYDGTVFYRVQPGFVLQAGSYKADGSFKGGLRKQIMFEGNNGLKNIRGSIAMARGDAPVSADAEFFINLSDTPGLDWTGDAAFKTGYAVFGHVTGGMDVVDAISKVPTNGGKGPFPKAAPVTPVTIKKATVTAAP